MSYRRYRDHLAQTVLTLGLILLAGVVLSLAAEQTFLGTSLAWLPGRPPGASLRAIFLWVVRCLRATLSTACASVVLLLPVVGALVAVPWLTARLIHRLYAMRDIKQAHDALNRKVFGQLGFGPFLLIREGAIARGRDSSIQKMGGPASLVVYNDTAVVTQQYGRPNRVLGPGFHRLGRFENVWETVDLRPQRWVHEVFALTREGIPVSCEADISFKIEDGLGGLNEQIWSDKVRDEIPFPYTDEAVFQAATSKWIREPDRKDRALSWPGRVVVGFVEGLLRDTLAEFKLDWLIAPPQPDQDRARDKIRTLLREGLLDRAPTVGVKITRVELGNIQVKARDRKVSERLSSIVSEQWIEAWYANWESQALTRKAEGEAELLRLDSARMQAQAEMVITLTQALRSSVPSEEATEPYEMALRFVEALRWMSYDPYTRDFMPPEAMRTLRKLRTSITSTSSGYSGEALEEP